MTAKWTGRVVLVGHAVGIGRGADFSAVLFEAGNFRRMPDEVKISNGIAWAPDGRRIYCVDSPTRAIRRFDFEAESGAITGGEAVISFLPEADLPHGCAIDAGGNLWVAHWGRVKLTRSNP